MNWIARSPIFATVTPFRTDGAIDEQALMRYLGWLSDRGAMRVVVCGTTGEFASLTLTERKSVLEITRAAFAGQVIAHVSACAVEDVRDLLRHANAHADAALLLPPYYFADAPPEGVGEFYRIACMGLNVPMYVYNFPRHTQCKITPELLRRLSQEIPLLRGIKDSGGNWADSVAFKRELPRLEVVVGSDSAALRSLQEGLDGSVTGGANPVPQLITEVHRQFSAGNMGQAAQVQQKLDGWTSARKATGHQEIPLVKAVLSKLVPDFPLHVRPPLCAVEATPELVRLANNL